MNEPIVPTVLPAPIREEVTPASADPEKWKKAGETFYLNNQYLEAAYCFERAVRAAPDRAEFHANFGAALQQLLRFEEAQMAYNQALALDPKQPEALVNLGWLTHEMGYPEHAKRFFERTLEVQPTNAMACANLSVHHLTRFNFPDGWRYFNARFATIPPTAIMRIYEGMPVWDGKPCRKLAIWHEQGLGDIILFGTLLRELEFRQQDFVLEIATRLIPAFKRAFPNREVVGTEESMTAFATCDAHTPMMALGPALRPTRESFTRLNTPRALLKHADPERTKEYASVYHSLGEKNFYRAEGKKNIAFSWKSHAPSRPQMDAKKSGTLAMFKVLGDRDDINLVSVQYERNRGDLGYEISQLKFRPRFVAGLDTFNDIEGVLAVIDAMDIVVTTCNVTAHFGAALGKPTYVMYPRNEPPIWYWAHEDGRCLWYPTVRIVTGKDMRTYEDCIAAVSEML